MSRRKRKRWYGEIRTRPEERDRFTIPMDVMRQVLEHVLSDIENEVCGIIGSYERVAMAVHPLRNVYESVPIHIGDQTGSSIAFETNPVEQYEAEKAIEDAGLDLGIIYHSHPWMSGEPSGIDTYDAMFPITNEPRFPGTLYLIVGFRIIQDEVRADIRLWEYLGHRYKRVEIDMPE